ncbi:MAG: DUF4369 domain-containing protein [Bacteroidales bacterium]|nr:DUF4369 domain-containing protein [Bacteroidales bacterium]
MKKICLAIGTALLLAACNGGGECIIKGSLPQETGGVYIVNEEEEVLDSCAVVDGKFALRCGRSAVEPVALVMGEYAEPLILVPESSSITVNIDGSQASITGSRLSQELAGLQKWAMSAYMDYMDKIEKLYEDEENEAADALIAERGEVICKHCRKVFKAHKNDYVGIQAMILMMRDLDRAEFFSLYETAGEGVKNYPMIASYYKSFEEAKE